MLDGHKITDVVVLLRDLPTIELTRQIGQVLTEKLGGCETIYQPYGFDVEQEGVCVRVVFAVKNFDEISNIQQGVHGKLIFSILYSLLDVLVLHRSNKLTLTKLPVVVEKLSLVKHFREE